MFKQSFLLFERSKSKFPLLYKRVLKNIEEDKSNKKDLLLHCFYNQYCNIPIPINDIIKQSKKNSKKPKADAVPSAEKEKQVDIDSLFAPNVLQDFYSTKNGKTTTIDFNRASKDKNFKEQLDLIKLGKFTKIEFLINKKKFTPFLFKEPFNKEDYLKEFELISHFQKTLRETSPFIDAQEANDVTPDDNDKSRSSNSELELEDVTPKMEKISSPSSNDHSQLPFYAALRKSIRARESLKRFLKKRKINNTEIKEGMLMKEPDRLNNDFYKSKHKSMLLWKHSKEKKKLHFLLGKDR